MKRSITRTRQIILFAGDIFCLVFGLVVALAIRYGWPIPEEQIIEHKTPFSILFAVWLFVFFSGGIYNLRKSKNARSFFALFFTLFGINSLIAVLFFYFIPFFAITPKTVMFLDLVITAALFAVWHLIFNKFAGVAPPLSLAVLGTSPEVKELISDIEKHPQQGYKCVFHAEHPHDNLLNMLKQKEADVVVSALDYRNSPELQKSLFECIPLHIKFFDFVDFYEQYFQKIPLAAIDRAWFLENLNETEKQFFSLIKRAVDIFIAVLCGLISIIFIPFIVIAILIDSGRPIFYSQMRLSQFAKPFRIYKFRSMKSEGNEDSVTRVGRFIRATHLDEIPQLWNILKGDMSFVGPRPEITSIVDDLKEKIPFYTERLLVRPGITGWAQLHEPKAKAADALGKLQYDLFYVKHRSLLLDIEIILKTLRVLIA